MYKHKPTIKVTIKSICLVLLSRIFVQKIFCNFIIKASVADFLSSKIPCFQHILPKTFIFIYLFTHLILDIQTTFRLPSLIAKPFVGNTLKVKAGSPIQVIKNKNIVCSCLLIERAPCMPAFACPDQA